LSEILPKPKIRGNALLAIRENVYVGMSIAHKKTAFIVADQFFTALGS
jgi:hypothetical protein